MQKTWSQKSSDIKRDWQLIDASGKSLGRLASVVAQLLSGKHKSSYTPHVTGGDHVIVVNSNQIVLTGKKWTDKKYYSHSRYTGSLKEYSAKDRNTEDLVRDAVKGMLPKNKLRSKSLKRLRVFKNSNHDYEDKDPKDYPLS